MDLVYCKELEGTQGLLHTLPLNMFAPLLLSVKGFYRQLHFGCVQKKKKKILHTTKIFFGLVQVAVLCHYCFARQRRGVLWSSE